MSVIKISQAVILAGGLGTRMHPLTLSTPKPMIKINGKPFLEYIIESLKKNSITDIVILVGYFHEQIEDYFKNGKKFGVSISYSYDPPETDTGARIRNALPYLQQKFLLLYGDNYWPLQLDSMIEFYNSVKTDALVTVYSNTDKATKNNVYVNEKGYVQVYDRTRRKLKLNGVDIGFFILDKTLFYDIPADNFSFEDIIVPRLIKQKKLAGFITHHKYYGLSNPSRIPLIEKFFLKKKFVFLDRDGVINRRPEKAHYVTKWSEFILLPRVREAFRELARKEYNVIIVSNQPGIARRKLSRKQADLINMKMLDTLKKEGTHILGVYICPHGWDEGCSCRKPSPGLFFQAASQHGVDLFTSYCIGDDPRDIIAGSSAGCRTILITQEQKTNKAGTEECNPDMIAEDLYSAVKKI